MAASCKCMENFENLNNYNSGIRLYVKSQDPFKMSFNLKLRSFVSVPSLFKKEINAFNSLGIE